MSFRPSIGVTSPLMKPKFHQVSNNCSVFSVSEHTSQDVMGTSHIIAAHIVALKGMAGVLREKYARPAAYS